MRLLAAKTHLPRGLIAAVALYALLLKVLLAAAMPMAVALPVGGIICTHDGSVPEQPTDNHHVHDSACCTAACAGLALFARVAYFHILLWPAGDPLAFPWATRTGAAPRPPPLTSATPRGPPRTV